MIFNDETRQIEPFQILQICAVC